MNSRPDDTLVYEQAAEWHILRQDASWSGEDERLLQQWLQEDVRHAEVYNGMVRSWNDFDQVRPPAIGPDSSSIPEASPRRPVPPRGMGKTLPAVYRYAMAAALLLALTAGGWWASFHIPRYETTLATNHDTRSRLSLPDGSVVTANIDTELAVHFYRNRREVELLRGEAYFEVSASSDQPFTVQAGQTSIRVVGTAFNVSAAPLAGVQVNHGIVDVRLAGSTGDALRLTAGQAVRQEGANFRKYRVGSEAVGAWRDGMLVFHDTPLATVVAELGRYTDFPIRLASPNLAERAVSGYANVRNPNEFLASLQDLLGVTLRYDSAGAAVLSTR